MTRVPIATTGSAPSASGGAGVHRRAGRAGSSLIAYLVLVVGGIPLVQATRGDLAYVLLRDRLHRRLSSFYAGSRATRLAGRGVATTSEARRGRRRLDQRLAARGADMDDIPLDLSHVAWSSQKEAVRVFYKELWDKVDVSLVPRLFHPDFTFRGSLGPSLTGHDQFIGIRSPGDGGVGSLHVRHPGVGRKKATRSSGSCGSMVTIAPSCSACNRRGDMYGGTARRSSRSTAR